jgi:hypothetical protein
VDEVTSCAEKQNPQKTSYSLQEEKWRRIKSTGKEM